MAPHRPTSIKREQHMETYRQMHGGCSPVLTKHFDASCTALRFVPLNLNEAYLSNQTCASLKLIIKHCEKCGYTEHPEILEIHHKDLNRRNNSRSNLTVLCPNCHRLTHKKRNGVKSRFTREVAKNSSLNRNREPYTTTSCPLHSLTGRTATP
jgi:hypothetical protein